MTEKDLPLDRLNITKEMTAALMNLGTISAKDVINYEKTIVEVADELHRLKCRSRSILTVLQEAIELLVMVRGRFSMKRVHLPLPTEQMANLIKAHLTLKETKGECTFADEE